MEAGLLETSQAFNRLRSWVREGFFRKQKGSFWVSLLVWIRIPFGIQEGSHSWKLPCRDRDNRFCAAVPLEGFRADREIFEL